MIQFDLRIFFNWVGIKRPTRFVDVRPFKVMTYLNLMQKSGHLNHLNMDLKGGS